MATDTFRRSLRLLGTRQFGTFWFASFLSNIGTWAQQVAEPWLLLSLGTSSFVLGLDSFAMGAPVLALTIVGGVLADKGNRRNVITLFQSIQMLCPTLIVYLLWKGAITSWIIVALSLVVGITDALSMPSFQSIVPSIVEPKQLSAGIALNATQFNLSRILGPVVAGALMASVGAMGAFVVSAVSYVPFILVAMWILPKSAHTLHRRDRFDWPAVAGALRLVSRDPNLRGSLLTVLATSTLCVPLVTFAPLLVTQSFHGNVSHFSVLIAAFGGGGLVGAMGLLAVRPERDRRTIGSSMALIYAGSLMLIALAPWFWALPVFFALAGIAMTAGNSSFNTLILAAAPATIRGQSVSLFMLAVRGGASFYYTHLVTNDADAERQNSEFKRCRVAAGSRARADRSRCF